MAVVAVLATDRNPSEHCAMAWWLEYMPWDSIVCSIIASIGVRGGAALSSASMSSAIDNKHSTNYLNSSPQFRITIVDMVLGEKL